jgi:hypothetical protein
VAGAKVAGVQKLIGYFDDSNGIFFRVNGLTSEMVIRSNVSGAPVDTAIPQAAWNLDRLDGTGPSGLTLDVADAQIFVCDFQWLGVGAVRVGFDIDGLIVWAHVFKNANSLTSVYMRTPNLPLRWEILGQGTASTLEAICCSVASEGGQQEPIGIGRSVDRGGAAASWKSLTSANAEQVIALRLQAGRRGPAYINDFDLITTATPNLYWAICLNPTVGGAAVWTPVTNSVLEFDVNLTASGSRIVSSFGTILASGYVAGVNRTSSVLKLGALQSFTADFAGTPDVISLVCRPDGNQSVAASLSYVEPS